MRIHDTLALRKRLSLRKRSLLADAEWLGDGAYSRVYAISDQLVLKLTCCARTQALLDHLLATPKASYPAGLPIVFEAWGLCGTDADDVPFKGYVLERLFSSDDIAGQIRARRTTLDLQPWRSSRAKPAFGHTKKNLLELQSNLEAARERCLLRERPAAQEHLEMSLQLASLRLPYAMEKTFAFLAGFLRDSGAELDLFQAGNILVDRLGAPVLADPVADQTDCYVAGPADEGERFALVAKQILRIDGLTVYLGWSTLAVAEDETDLAQEAHERRQQDDTILETKVLQLGCLEQVNLVQAAEQAESLWAVPRPALAAFRDRH